MEKTFKFSVIVPLFDNDGVSLEHETELVKAELLKISGGFTALPIVGEWADETGKVYHDASNLFYSYVDQEKLDRLTDCAQDWNELLRQECLMVEVTEVRIAFVTSRVKVAA